jgi:hypothetical protein
MLKYGTDACKQEIVQANEDIRLGADLASKYRKNAQFNIEALRASGALDGPDGDQQLEHKESA